ncbi:STAS domain-containing protein [Actinokineospora bangkokensis]|uniref:STAS domain-containing protein n=1 Tax=Actinokineospora bangkokensis TaxID=1193682 RepID=A0A1Q9LNH8_9PSEU|nr:STAS domain-containing protein [Actinokineospora bangkokensis]OLR93549.1 hypothetical protein BJP25_14735 [Actinokineospora bangkokensis]
MLVPAKADWASWRPDLSMAVLTPTDDLDLEYTVRLGEAADEVLAIAEQHAETCRAVVVDMRAVEFIDSTGLSKLIGLREGLEGSSTTAQLHLVVSADQDIVRRLFEITGLGDVLSILPDMESVVSAVD